ncbi:regulation of response to stimulus [Branchiostoma belcheri]|nr:regulation of response to stimulus [Branchiostoma belcheri]
MVLYITYQTTEDSFSIEWYRVPDDAESHTKYSKKLYAEQLFPELCAPALESLHVKSRDRLGRFEAHSPFVILATNGGGGGHKSSSSSDQCLAEWEEAGGIGLALKGPSSLRVSSVGIRTDTGVIQEGLSVVASAWRKTVSDSGTDSGTDSDREQSLSSTVTCFTLIQDNKDVSFFQESKTQKVDTACTQRKTSVMYGEDFTPVTNQIKSSQDISVNRVTTTENAMPSFASYVTLSPELQKGPVEATSEVLLSSQTKPSAAAETQSASQIYDNNASCEAMTNYDEINQEEDYYEIRDEDACDESTQVVHSPCTYTEQDTGHTAGLVSHSSVSRMEDNLPTYEHTYDTRRHRDENTNYGSNTNTSNETGASFYNVDTETTASVGVVGVYASRSVEQEKPVYGMAGREAASRSLVEAKSAAGDL